MRSTIVALLFGLSVPLSAQATEATQETILFIRHAEKAPSGLGQLSCRGLNRALALPAALKVRYGHIDAVFAPDPSHRKDDGGAAYDYLRPLATVEPTAIRFGLPVNTQFGFEQGVELRAALIVPEARGRTVLVAWEHHMLDKLVPALVVALGGDGTIVPDWPGEDFDSIWKVTITWAGAARTVAFAHDHQGLDGQSDICPNEAAPPLEGSSPIVLEHK